ncbi:hypothetical protein K504DRAFT_534510 [Pleomassaria siparia CBS 279.74]|uniref:Uncharacterized protein n=1 Tax=Pleomassaria siparia CBS 279.74 TaxID=1314801 RepID=A0A6G1K821_9PLEO|nr:hypothetical protein K504DRAFT_534510 [Pleomassaria siparia CBS 279.74]
MKLDVQLTPPVYSEGGEQQTRVVEGSRAAVQAVAALKVMRLVPKYVPYYNNPAVTENGPTLAYIADRHLRPRSPQTVVPPAWSIQALRTAFIITISLEIESNGRVRSTDWAAGNFSHRKREKRGTLYRSLVATAVGMSQLLCQVPNAEQVTHLASSTYYHVSRPSTEHQHSPIAINSHVPLPSQPKAHTTTPGQHGNYYAALVHSTHLPLPLCPETSPPLTPRISTHTILILFPMEPTSSPSTVPSGQSSQFCTNKTASPSKSNIKSPIWPSGTPESVAPEKNTWSGTSSGGCCSIPACGCY